MRFRDGERVWEDPSSDLTPYEISCRATVFSSKDNFFWSKE